MRRTARSIAVVMAFALAAIFGSGLALAHAKLASADPAPNTTVAAPQVIRLQFSEQLAKRFSNFKLTDTDGDPVPTTPIDGQDDRSLAAKPTATLGPGVYTVSWTAVSTDDGHRTMGTYSFTVQ